MTVKRLKEMLEDVPDDMVVYVAVQTEGVFAFQEACDGESGECDFGPPPEDIYSKEAAEAEMERIGEQGRGFILLPHGFADHPKPDANEHLNN